MARNFLQLGNGKAKCQLCGDKIKTGIPQISHRAYQSSASFHANAKDCFPRSKAHIKKNGCPHCGVVDIDGFRKRHIYEGFECTHCYQPVSADRYKNAEEYNVEFNEWADQEMNSHGKNISFKDWSKDEGLKHGNTEITEWAQHEDESHDARYGAENYRYIKPVPISHSGGGDKYNGYYAIKGYEQSTADGFTYRILSSPGTSDWYRVYIYDTEKMFKNKSRRLNPSGEMVGSSDPASHLIGSFPRLDDAKRALVFRMIQDEQYHHILSDGNLNWLLHGKNPGSRKWKAESFESEGKKRSGILSDPFEEASLDSGGTKKVLLGIGLGIIGYFGYNKWK